MGLGAPVLTPAALSFCMLPKVTRAVSNGHGMGTA